MLLRPAHEMMKTPTQILVQSHSHSTLLEKVSRSRLKAAEMTAHQAGEMQAHAEEGPADDLSCCHFFKMLLEMFVRSINVNNHCRSQC